MIVQLKSNQYYDFYNIRSVKIIDEDRIIVRGNFGIGKKYADVEMFKRMILKDSFKELMKYCRKYFKRFDFEGVCPKCELPNISYSVNMVVTRKLNDPKSKPELSEITGAETLYHCNRCNFDFFYEDLKYCDVVLYYR